MTELKIFKLGFFFLSCLFVFQSNNYARTNIYNPGAVDNPNGTNIDTTRKPPLEPSFLELDEERITLASIKLTFI